MIWDSHPLALGAAPQQVFIDGIAQLQDPHVTPKPTRAQKVPKTPNFDREAQLAVKYDGLPPLAPHAEQADYVLFTNVGRVHMRGHNCEISQVYSVSEAGKPGVVFTKKGKVVCVGLESICGKEARAFKSQTKVIDLQGGSVA